MHKNYRKRIISAGEFEISDLKLPKETGAERCFAVDKKKQEEYHFVKEHIKKIPIDRKKLRTRLFGTILLAVLFGVVAAAVFAALRPVFDNLLYRKDNTVVISGEDEISEETPEENAPVYITETQLMEPEDYQAILDKMDDGIFIVNRQGSIIAVNKAVEKNGGKKMHELIGRNIDDLVKEGYCTEFVSRRVIESGREEILVQHTKDNKELLVTGRPYYKNGQLEMVVACERDVTELAKTKEKLSKVKIMNEEYQKELENLRKVNSQSSGVVRVSRNMKQTIEMAKKVARLDTTVLIQGESGTGKEVLAKLICSESPRSRKPFIKVNCGAIPENLLESEMFGYVEGAFTGAKKAGKEGYFGMANGGTIFLDEVNELPFNLQVKLLRVIQEREMMPVGSDRPVKLDIRIIASTNKDLKKLVARGKSVSYTHLTLPTN